MTDIAELVQRLRVYSEDVAAFDLEIARTVREAADALEAQLRDLTIQAKRIAELERKLENASTNAVAEHFISSMEIAQGLQSDDPETKVAAIERLYESFRPRQK